MAELVGKRYSASLFEVGIELDKMDTFHKEINFIKDIIEENNSILKILEHPEISKREKKDVVSEIFGEMVSKEILNFLFITIDKRREKNIINIVDEFNKLFKDYRGIVDIEAITAVPMNEEASERLKTVLRNKLEKKINLSNRVDPSIIGGVMLNMDEKIIDSTLKTQLGEMESMFKEISL